MLVGLNPYGLCCTLGFIGTGERAAPQVCGLDGFLALAEEIGGRCIEFDLRLLADADLGRVNNRIEANGWVPVLAAGMPGDHLSSAIEIATQIGAKVIRMHMTPVLCGARASRPDWPDLVQRSRDALAKWAPAAANEGVELSIEDHQDLGSAELLEYAETAGPNVGICLDTGNPLAVGEDVLPFTQRVAHKVNHVHLKDYRVQITDEGYRLVSCPIGDGCVPLEKIADALGPKQERITASLEPGALEARHVRLFTEDWWLGYPQRDARELAGAFRTGRKNRIKGDEPWQSPWEQNASGAVVVAHERRVLEKSVKNMKSIGWL